MEVLPFVQKVGGSLHKVCWWYKKLMEVDGRSPGYTESLRKLTKSLSAARKDEGSLQKSSGGI